jgi:hypothetical protein
VVSAWWLLGAFFVGGYAGIVLLALMTAIRSDPEDTREHNAAVYPSTSGHPPEPALDWII